MAILHLISDTQRRGAQVFAVQLAQELQRLGIDGSVAALTTSPGVGNLDVPVIDAGWRARRSALRSADLVIAHGSTTLDVAALTAPRRFIYRSIGDPTFWLDRPSRRSKTGLLLQSARCVVVLYPAAAEAMRSLARVPRGRLRVIPNGVGSLQPPGRAKPPPLTRAARHVLYVGALSWEKQVDQLIRAVGQLEDTGLILVGDGPEREPLERLAHEVLGDRAMFAGGVVDPGPYYRACDALGLTSKTEGMPACILEAALAGLPTCAYAVGGISEMIIDRSTGTLVDPDNRAALAEALGWTLSHADELGAAAVEHVRAKYSMSTVGAQWRDVILDELAAAR